MNSNSIPNRVRRIFGIIFYTNLTETSPTVWNASFVKSPTSSKHQFKPISTNQVSMVFGRILSLFGSISEGTKKEVATVHEIINLLSDINTSNQYTGTARLRRKVQVTLGEVVPLAEAFPENVLERIIGYLPQNDVVSLGQTCGKLKRMCEKKLFRKIVVSKFVPLSSDGNSYQQSRMSKEGVQESQQRWWYVDSNYTVIGGSRNQYHVASYQNDEILLTKIASLANKLLIYDSKNTPVEELVVQDDLFNCLSNQMDLWERLASVIYKLITANSNSIKVLKIFSSNLQYNKILYNIPGLFPKLINLTIDSVEQLSHLRRFPAVTSLTIVAQRDDFQHGTFSGNVVKQLYQLEELVILDEEDSALRVLKFISDVMLVKLGTNHPKLQLKSLKFNHYHGLRDYNSISRNLSIIVLEKLLDLSVLTTLDLIINCEEPNCECFDSFLNSLATQTISLERVSLQEKLYKHQQAIVKHQVYEDWDLRLFSFLNNLPNKNLITTIMLKNDSPIDGNIEDGLEGNYLRRQKLFETTLPKFVNLHTLILPNILSSICCYEQVVSDLLWNGCECESCEKYLSIFDTYLMTHQYFDYNSFSFKDMISPRLFGFFADTLSKRVPFFNNKLDVKASNAKTYYELLRSTASQFSSLTSFEIMDSINSMAPNFVSWDLHGYSKIICRDFKNDNDDDFYDEELIKFIPNNTDGQDEVEDPVHPKCYFNESCFNILAYCVNHYYVYRQYLEFLASNNTNLRLAVLNGIYYGFEEEEGRQSRFFCIYD